jgi:hypothetical protein
MQMTLVPVQRLDLVLTPRPWPFAIQKRDQIDTFFNDQRAVNPALWNGQVLLLHGYAIRDAVFQGAYFQTDFASMLAWRHWDFPDRSVRSCFAMGRPAGERWCFSARGHGRAHGQCRQNLFSRRNARAQRRHRHSR